MLLLLFVGNFKKLMFSLLLETYLSKDFFLLH